ncbi:MAG: ABC transporter permease subunit [Desulfurococcales archaeon]|nr:ABC transporter permease subunit [Desulfurococcales archaeon]
MKEKAYGGVVILALLTLIALLVYRANPECLSKYPSLQHPDLNHPLGTDPVGRDALCLLVAGLVSSVEAGLSALATSLLILILAVYLSTSKLLRGLVNATASILTGLPRISLLLLLALTINIPPLIIGVIIGALASMQGVRGVVARTRQVTASTYVEASKAIGANTLHIATKHVLPNTWSAIASYTSIASSVAVYAEAGLSMIGLGDPSIPSWGKMVGLILETPGAILTNPGIIQVSVPLLFTVAMASIFYISLLITVRTEEKASL